jgi:hypothetical protein
LPNSIVELKYKKIIYRKKTHQTNIIEEFNNENKDACLIS